MIRREANAMMMEMIPEEKLDMAAASTRKMSMSSWRVSPFAGRRERERRWHNALVTFVQYTCFQHSTLMIHGTTFQSQANVIPCVQDTEADTRQSFFFFLRDCTLPWFCVGWACGLSYPQPPDQA